MTCDLVREIRPALRWCSFIVILNKRSLRSEEPVPSEAEGIWASRAMCRVLCVSITARLARYPIELHLPDFRSNLDLPYAVTDNQS